MRKSLLILLVVEFSLAVALTQVGTMHRSQFNRAFMEWYEHPTVETRQAFERQKRITEYERWGFSGAVFAVLAGATVSVYWFKRRGEPNASPNGGPATMITWATARKEYVGFPLMLRRPTNLDVDSLRPSHPTLAVVTHEFSKRKPNGLPQPDYNESLFEMDIELASAFDVDQMGVPVLIETFGGKRHYYFYVASDTDVPAIISAFARRYPSERLSWTVRPDPEWGFLERYAKEHF